MKQKNKNARRHLSGTCKHCGCSEDNACVLAYKPGHVLEFCRWVNAARTVCSNPACVAKERT
jgi:hypothetical protein